MMASTALIWTMIEILALLFSLYVMNVTSTLKLLDLLSYCGYKYIGSVNCMYFYFHVLTFKGNHFS